MPTYQYVCTDCGTDLEAVQSFSEPSLTVCPTCGGTLRKRFSAVGVVFKGSGFYRNDSRSEGRGGSSERKAETTEKSESKPETKSDSTTKAETKSEPAAKSESKPKSDSGSGSSSGSSSSSSSGSKASSAA